MKQTITDGRIDVALLYITFADIEEEVKTFLKEYSLIRRHKIKAAGKKIVRIWRARKQARIIQAELDFDNKTKQEQAHTHMVRIEEERIRNAKGKKAMEELKEEMRARLEQFNKNNQFTCSRKGCEGRIFKKRNLFQLHEKMHYNADMKVKKILLEKQRKAKIRLANEKVFLEELSMERREKLELAEGGGQEENEVDASTVDDSTTSSRSQFSTKKKKTKMNEKIRDFKWTVVSGQLVKTLSANVPSTSNSSSTSLASVADDVLCSQLDLAQDINFETNFENSDSDLSSVLHSLAEEDENEIYDEVIGNSDDRSFASLSDDEDVQIPIVSKKKYSIYGEEVDDFFRATSPTSFQQHISHIMERPASPSIPTLFLEKKRPLETLAPTLQTPQIQTQSEPQTIDVQLLQLEEDRMLLANINSVYKADSLLSQRSFLLDDSTITSTLTDEFGSEQDFLSARFQQSEQDFLSARSSVEGIEVSEPI